jgi:hypothetical protein
MPSPYFLGAFFHDSFLAQVASELFAVAMWWALVVWDERPSNLALTLFAAAGVGAFLTWPVWIGPPLVALLSLVIVRDDLSPRARAKAIALAVTPVLTIAIVHAMGRVGWLGMAGTSGAVLRPALSSFGWVFVILSCAGLLVAVFTREARPTLLLSLSIIVQAVSLYVVARSRGASTPYMAFKMVYLLIYPAAVLAVLAVASAFNRATTQPAFARAPRGAANLVAWAILVGVVVLAREPLRRFSVPTPVLSSDLYSAGRWARGHLEHGCVDYLVPNADTMYWLHLAVLGNARSSLRSANPDTFVPDRAVARWIEPGGLPYAIAHLPTLPKAVRNDVDVIEEFGTAAVVRRQGPASCDDAQRLAGGGPPSS